MPHVGGTPNAEDLASSDEIKVFKEEGDDEKRASAELTDLKSSLITEGDQVRLLQPFYIPYFRLFVMHDILTTTTTKAATN